MINLDTRIIDELDGNELAVFCHLIKRIGKNNECFPSRELLMKETGFGREKVAKTITSLKNKDVILTFQNKSTDGKFAKTHYRIKTKHASVFVNVNNELLIEENRDTENRSTENPLTGKSQLSINQNLSIKQDKKTPVIDFDGLLIFLNEKTGRNFRTINKSVKSKFKARIKDGYKKEDILNAIINTCNNNYHKENGYQYLTPEFFSRAGTLDKYGFQTNKGKVKKETHEKMENNTFTNF